MGAGLDLRLVRITSVRASQDITISYRGGSNMRPPRLVAGAMMGLFACTFLPMTSGQAASEHAAAHPEKTQGERPAMEREVTSQAEHEMSQQKKKIIEEALLPIAETKKALKALNAPPAS